MKSLRIMLTVVLCAGACYTSAGEVKPPAPDNSPPTVKPPDKPPIIPPQPRPNPAVDELNLLVTDLLNGDAAKRDAAGKALVAKGMPAYNRLTILQNNADADVAKRAKDIRTQIEQRGVQMMQDANALQEKMQSAPLTAAAIDGVRNAWMQVFQYAPQNEIRQFAMRSVQAMQSTSTELVQANQALAESDKALAAQPPPPPLLRASLLMDRTQVLLALQRTDDVLKAAQSAYEAGGKESRFAPAALKVQAEMFQRKQDPKASEGICKKIIADYPDSLEARFAYGALIELHTEGKNWDEAVEALKKYISASPLDEGAQEQADSLLDELMEVQHDYPRAYGLAVWLSGKLPLSRMRKETLQALGKCSEFSVRDYAKAEAAYKSLAMNFNDVVKPAEIEPALKRVKAKAEGKFPKEPKAGDEGPAGALAQFLAAVRARDGKLLAAAVPEAESKEAPEKLTCEECTLVSVATFGDFIVKDVRVEGDRADITIDYYDAAEPAPRAIVQKAVKEKGAWKIQWTDPEEQLEPAATTPKPQKPAPGK